MKYIIDVSDEAIELMGGHISIFVEPVFKTGDCKHYALRLSKEDIEPYTEPDRKAIEDAQEEAWEFAKQISIMNPEDKCELWGTAKYNTINLGYSYSEAKAKYEAWKKQKDDIHVGDEVEYECECDGIVRFVVTGFCGETAFGFKHPCDYDDVGEYCDIDMLTKTGRHFTEVTELLKKVRDTE